jgi:hypothetical protein
VIGGQKGNAKILEAAFGRAFPSVYHYAFSPDRHSLGIEVTGIKQAYDRLEAQGRFGVLYSTSFWSESQIV